MKHHTLLTLAGALLAAPAFAQTSAPAPASRISAVTLYPGSATVERVLHLPAGATRAVFGCLPAQLDARTLQVSSPAEVRIGDVNVQTMERAVASGCAGALDERIRAAEDELARARAETDALELAQTWLNTQAGTPPVHTRDSLAPAQIAATLQALRRSSLDTLTELHRARRALQERELALKRLQAEQGSAQAAKVAVVRVSLATRSGGELRLSYQVRGPSWSPSYRASLDSDSRQVQLERLALVAQTTGEDWSGVQLTLSTGQPLAATQGPLPRPWTLDVQPKEPPPVPKMARSEGVAMMAAPAPPAPALAAEPDAEPLPSFEASTRQGTYATQFVLPQRVSVPSGGERVTLSLGAQQLAATLLTRTTPALDAHAWLVALLGPLQGNWPAGPIALQRDGASVGQGRFDPMASDFARLGLAFGRDESVLVSSEPVKEFTQSAGFTGARSERSVERSYRVENRHRQAITLQVLDSAPVSRNEAITVQSRYEPKPQDDNWGGKGGVAWQQELDAGASAVFSARHVIGHDKDVRVREGH
ncbi:DUF4139 domain-containing protein [Comamonas flocculans]|uniref:DUF4139 domain-containing protein n=1 Tax=Comamonas flocculans TaxID=2597701 RepID=A0A5B8RU80_9BURK|nr:DUF4139 domain-containing protein [Comamonas flocculans]QEA13106.1 DUF4139 domain-containing protein [Comamonas flocculans]